MKKNTYRDDVTPAPLPGDQVATNDPKYAFVDGRIWSVNGSYYIPKDEPVIVFRGKDQAAIAAIIGYLECLDKQTQSQHVKDHITTARERLDTFLSFQSAHPEFVGIGCGVEEKLNA